MRLRPRLLGAVLALATLATTTLVGPAPASAQSSTLVNGAGSSYVALAMQQWVTDGTARGLRVNYTPTSSPDGLQRYSGSQINFGGTEAEFSSFGQTSVPRGYQYVPDVAGAIAMMYNLKDRAGNKVDYLHLSQRTTARIFLGNITTWADPAISAENAGFRFPDKPINVVFRSGQSGTTALFYDFVKHAAPDVFAQWAARFQVNPNIRILEPPPRFAPQTQGLGGSDQIAQFIAGDSGAWSIGYDEFGYAKTYHVPVAWIQNASGKWWLPYAENISAALESATLRPDLSQELSGVYASGHPKAYPISAYSYVVTQCRTGDRPSCQGPYADQGITDTLAPWLRYIACDGQANMAGIGYSPLPPNLSQEVANAVARLTGEPAERLSAGSCGNPRFRGSLGPGAESPPDPYDELPGGVCGAAGCDPEDPGGSDDPAGPDAAADPDGPGAGAGPDATDPDAGPEADTDGPTDEETAAGPDAETGLDGGAGRTGDEQAVGGGSDSWRVAAPTAYRGPRPAGLPPGTAVCLAVAVLAPLFVVGGLRRRRARRP
ncbi:MAG TPA: substrate-binding domain-containing protein [Iamia sp.]|jgi:phosphate transport system substrate-binding protein|nr:substrate-binding domain-containing protein [Iamia sp.]